MADLRYREIKALRDRMGLGNMSVADFAKASQEIDPANNYTRGIEGLNFLKELELGIEGSYSGLKDAVAKAGEINADTAEAGTRMGINAVAGLAPVGIGAGIGSAIAPGPGTLAGAGIGKIVGGVFSGISDFLDTYEETNSLGAATFSGVLGGVAPGAGGKLASRLATTGLTKAGASVVSNAGQTAFKSFVPRAVTAVSEQAGQFGGNLLSGATTAALAAEKGERFEAFKESFNGTNALFAGGAQAVFGLPTLYSRLKGVRPAEARPTLDTITRSAQDAIVASSNPFSAPTIGGSAVSGKFVNGDLSLSSDTFSTNWNKLGTPEGPFGRTIEMGMTPLEREGVMVSHIKTNVAGSEAVFRSFQIAGQAATKYHANFSQSNPESFNRVDTVTRLLYEQQVALQAQKELSASTPDITPDVEPVKTPEENLALAKKTLSASQALLAAVNEKASLAAAKTRQYSVLSGKIKESIDSGKKAIQVPPDEPSKFSTDFENYARELDVADKVAEQRAKTEGPLPAAVNLLVKTAASASRSSSLLDPDSGLNYRAISDAALQQMTGDSTITSTSYGAAQSGLTAYKLMTADNSKVTPSEVAAYHKMSGGNSPVSLAQAHYALRANGLNGTASLGVASKLMSMWKHSIKVKSIEDAVNVHGVFTKDKTGGTVWLNTKTKAKNATLFTLAHEINGHGVWEAHLNGDLPEPMSKALEVFTNRVKSNDEKTNSLMLAELMDTLPKQVRRDIESANLLDLRGKDFEEVIANFNALVSLNMAFSSDRQSRLFSIAAPAELRGAVGAISRFAKGVFDALNVSRSGDTEYLEYGRLLKNFFHIEELDAKAKEGLLAMESLADSSKWHESLRDNNTAYFQQVWKNPAVTAAAKFLDIQNPSKPPAWYDRALMPIQLLGLKFSQFRSLLHVSTQRQNEFNAYQSEHLKIIGLRRERNRWVADDQNAFVQTVQNSQTGAALDNAVRRAQELQTRVADSQDDPEMRRIMGPLSQEQRKAVLDTVNTMEQVQQRNVSYVKELRYKDLTNMAALVLLRKKEVSTSDEAMKVASRMVDEIKAKGFSSAENSAANFINANAKTIEAVALEHASRPWYVSEQRFSRFKARINTKTDSTVIEANSQKELDQLIAAERAKPGFASYENLTDANASNIPKDLLTRLLTREKAHTDALEQSLLAAGLSQPEVNNLISQFGISEQIATEVQAAALPMSVNRKLKAGREKQNVVQQQLVSLDVTGRALTKKIAKSQFALLADDPSVKDHPALDMARKAFDNYLQPDHPWTKKINELNYAWFMGAHLLNMIQDAASPLLGVLPAFLHTEGHSVVGSFGSVLKGMAKASSKSKLTAEEQQLMAEFDKNNDALSLYTDSANNDVMAAVNARRISEGQSILSARDFLVDKFKSGYAATKGVHAVFTHFGHKSTALALFDFYRNQQKLDFDVAKKKTFESLNINTFAGGKANRPGMLAPGLQQPFAAMFLGLQNFALGTLFTAKTHFSKAFLNSGLEPRDRLRAGTALGMQLGTMWAVAGMFGMPGVGAALKVLQDQFGVDATLEMENFFEDTLGIDASLASQGALNSLAGFDVASRSGATGVLGISQNSTSIELGGPTASIVANLFGAITGGLQNDAKAVIGGLPQPVKRLAEMFHNNGDFRDYKGNLLEEGNFVDNTVYAMLGIKPTTVRDTTHYKSLVLAAQKNESRRREQFEQSIMSRYESGEDITSDLEAFAEMERQNKLDREQKLMRISPPEIQQQLELEQQAKQQASKQASQGVNSLRVPISATRRRLSERLFKRDNVALTSPGAEARQLLGVRPFGGLLD